MELPFNTNNSLEKITAKLNTNNTKVTKYVWQKKLRPFSKQKLLSVQ